MNIWFFVVSQSHAQICPSIEIVSQFPIQSTSLDEISGIAWQKENRFWVHNDSGDSSRLYQINQKGVLEGILDIPNIKARDWEDMAILRDNDKYVFFIGDIGDNKEKEDEYPIHVVTIDSNPQPKIVSMKTFFVQYANLGPRDAEGISVDPITEDIYILTKGRGGTAFLLHKKAPHIDNEHVKMDLIHQFSIPSYEGINIYRFTAMDISPDGNSMLWRDYQSAYLIKKSSDENWNDIWRDIHTKTHPICFLALPIQPQGESITFINNDHIASISEKIEQPFFILKLNYDVPIEKEVKP